MRKHRFRLTLVCLLLVALPFLFFIPSSAGAARALAPQAAQEVLCCQPASAPTAQPPQMRLGVLKPRPDAAARHSCLCALDQSASCTAAVFAARLTLPLAIRRDGDVPGDRSHPVHAPPAPMA